MKPAAAAGAGLLAAALLAAACRKDPDPGPEQVDRALEEFRLGNAAAAIERLEHLLADHAHGRIGDRASLVLGKLLAEEGRHAEALAPLARAARGRVAHRYASLLRVGAIADGGLEEHYGEALVEAGSLFAEESPLMRPQVREEARFLSLRLHCARRDWERAGEVGADFLDRWPQSRRAGEARWLTAEALRHSGRQLPAARHYAAIWYGDPGSPWAVEARQRLTSIEAATGTRTRSLSADEQLDFAAALLRYGLHEPALEELARFASRSPSHQRSDEALWLKAKSLHALRRNAECVTAVEELKRRFHRSERLPGAAIYAIKALRRNDNTGPIRSWVRWIVRNYPGRPEAFEALYNLGVYLSNVVSPEEGLEVLERLVATGGDDPHVDDALWKAAWIERRAGDTPRAVDALERLLDEHPRSPHRPGALYWAARFQAEDDETRAVALFRRCLEESPHDYYGHQSLASLRALNARPGRIGSPEPFPARGLLDDLEAAARRGDEVHAAAYLASVGLYDFAAAELAAFEGSGDDPALQLALAELTSRAGDPWKAIDIVQRHFPSFVTSGSRDPDLVPRAFWYVVYPYPYRAAIRDAIEEAGLAGSPIDPYLMAALIRLESRFLATAISPVGALGLMQLLPATARSLAAERGLPAPGRSELFDPATNVRYGAFYLAQLLRRFDGDWIPAICSYNAGAGAAGKWWRDRPQGQALDEFIESIPYVATRRYVQQVLGDAESYRWLYEEQAAASR